jgi:DNA polymerase iota
VFIDVTDLVYDHIDRISTSWQSSESIFFQLPASSQPLSIDKHPPGFNYNPSSLPGHVLAPASRSIIPGPNPTSSSSNAHTQALLVAGHLATFIRKKIKEQIGLTSSAGIARNKLLAKLVAGVKKPDAQTTFLAEPVGYGNAVGGDEHSYDDGEMVQKFLDAMEVRKLNGFGSKTVSILTDDLSRRSISYGTPLTVAQTRSLFVLSDFTRMFKDQRHRLWGLLHGIDDDPVKPNPEYPKQISVEDSYARTMKRSFGTIREQMLSLIKNLLRRLEDELMDDPEGGSDPGWLSNPCVRPAASKRIWKRFPTQFRLALRLDWDHPGGRDSKCSTMPAFIFDTTRSIDTRAAAIMDKVGVALLRDLLGIKKGDKVDDRAEFVVYV